MISLRKSHCSILFFFLLVLLCPSIFAQPLPILKVTDNGKFLETSEIEPFFWLGDTAWELMHRLKREEIDLYLTDRVEKGFTIIQTVILAEIEGLNEPNAYGHKPLINNDPTNLNEQYFTHVDYVVQKAEDLGLYIGLLPTWGDKFNLKWGVGPEIFDAKNAEIYGQLLAERFSSSSNIIWILGGDRIPEKEQHFEIIEAMATGIRSVDSEKLITYHPSGSQVASEYFDRKWLDVDMYQSGHSRNSKEYSYLTNPRPTMQNRPIINGEARYENIPDRFWEDEDYGWLDDADARVSGYWSIMAGAAGYTYGCNDIWQMYDVGREPTINARTGWKSALALPGASHMQYLKNVFEIFPWQTMAMDTSLIVSENKENAGYVVATIGADDDYILAYAPTGRAIEIDLKRIESDHVLAFWYNPRSGGVKDIGRFSTGTAMIFKPWASGWGSDFLLIIIDGDSAYDIKALTK